MMIMEYNASGAGQPSAGGTGTGARHRSETFSRIEETVAYMQQHLDQPLQVATLAAKANFSPSQFFLLFKRWVGSAPIDYFIRMRIQRAGRLLCDTNLSVKEVAARLGYDDPFYFSRIFKSVNSLSPSNYRAAQRQRAFPSGETKESAERPSDTMAGGFQSNPIRMIPQPHHPSNDKP
jgi:transcriptional regulator GlxA family with amidase domain